MQDIGPQVVTYLRIEIKRIIRSWLKDGMVFEDIGLLSSAAACCFAGLSATNQHVATKMKQTNGAVLEWGSVFLRFSQYQSQWKTKDCGDVDLHPLCFELIASKQAGRDVYAAARRWALSALDLKVRIQCVVAVTAFLGVDPEMLARQLILGTNASFEEASRIATVALATEDLPDQAFDIYSNLGSEKFWLMCIHNGDDSIDLRSDIARVTAKLSIGAILRLEDTVARIKQWIQNIPSSEHA